MKDKNQHPMVRIELQNEGGRAVRDCFVKRPLPGVIVDCGNYYTHATSKEVGEAPDLERVFIYRRVSVLATAA